MMNAKLRNLVYLLCAAGVSVTTVWAIIYNGAWERVAPLIGIVLGAWLVIKGVSRRDGLGRTLCIIAGAFVFVALGGAAFVTDVALISAFIVVIFPPLTCFLLVYVITYIRRMG